MASQKYIYVQSSDPPGGLHCLNLETGSEKWWFNPDGNMRGHTPAVDQTNGFVYFQTRNSLWKLNALTGALLDSVAVSNPAGSGMGSGNTILVNDGHGYFIAGVWNDYVAYGGGVKVYDANLDLVWEDIGLNLCLKSVMAYYDGVLFVPIGNGFDYSEIGDWYTGELENAGVIAYNITDGTELWRYICDPLQAFVLGSQRGVLDVVYCNGYIIFSVRFQNTTELYILDASDGSLVKKAIDSSASHTACGPSVLSGGRLYDGSTTTETIRVWTLGTGTFEDWNTYGSTPQLNHNVANAASLASIAETPAYLNEVAGGTQGGIIIDSTAYFIENLNLVKFNPDTLAVTSNTTIGEIYDSTPLMVENLAGDKVLLIKESANARVIAINPLTGERLWNSAGNMPGNLFFGMNYYELTYAQLANGISGESAIAGLNINFNTLNALIADAATIVTITSAVQWDDINANIASLNTEGVAVAVETITVGMTGAQFNNIINGFVTAYATANS